MSAIIGGAKEGSSTPSAASTRPPVQLDLPLPVVLVLAALVLGMAGGLGAESVVKSFGAAFGRALGDFTLILLPSFLIAASISRRPLPSLGAWVRLASPFSSAAMICHVTAYAALSPISGGYRLSMAMAAYAGFLLLVPAGPLIVGASLGVDNPGIYWVGILLLVPVFLAGETWLRICDGRPAADARSATAHAPTGKEEWRGFAPFGVLAILLGVGWSFDLAQLTVLDFLTRPKGALLLAAVWAYLDTPTTLRRDCIDAAVRRTGGLLLLVGAASAFGGMATAVVPVAQFLPSGDGGQLAVVLGLFGIAAAMKMLQGSTMATFAVVGPLVQPVVQQLSVSPVLAVYAICLGCFVAILPNDSYYLLVRGDALGQHNERSALLRMSGASIIQGAVGLAALLGLWALGVVG